MVLKGPLHCRLAPMLDGRHSTDAIVETLSDTASPAQIYFALEQLERQGYISNANGAGPSDHSALWHALGVDTRLAERRLEDTKVSVAAFGDLPLEPLVSGLAAVNLQVAKDGNFGVVFTDDYLQAGLDEFNTTALVSGRPWLLVKPTGTVLWIGPVFKPHQTACWECLASRLRGNREIETYLQRKKGSATPFTAVSGALVSSSLRVAVELAVAETLKAIVQDAPQSDEATLVTLDLLTMEMQKHPLVKRPQCPRCGASAYTSRREPPPVTLQPQKKQFTADGGHRSASPEQTIAKYERHISPITGAVTHLARMLQSEADGNLAVYFAGHNLAMRFDNLYFLRQGIRSKSGGKGMTDRQARASGLCEALERYSGNFQGDEFRIRGSYRGLGANAIHPNACMLFSEEQYRDRDAWNARGSRFERVPIPFDEDTEMDWTPVWSLTARAPKYLPTSFCYYGYPSAPAASFCFADSNGNAAGNTLEEAILQGFMELVERDCVALWWYNRIPRPQVDLDTFDEPYIAELRKRYLSMNRDVWMLDITNDLGIPAVVGVSRRTDQPEERILLGFGAHFDPRIAVLRALTEVNQSIAVVKGFDQEPTHYDPALRHWWSDGTIAGHPYLAPNGKTVAYSDYRAHWSDDVLDDVLRCQSIVENEGLEMLVLDQTRPDIGLPVVKVIVPGLRHFWARLAKGRMYDVPVRLGWLTQPLREDQLNPIAMFL